MSTERRPGFPNGDPEDYREKGRLEELRKQDLRDYKRRFRPVRLFVTSPERQYFTPTTDADWLRLLVTLITVSSDEDLVREIRRDLKQLAKDAKKIDEAHVPFIPLTTEEVEGQDAEGVINLMGTARTMSRKINLVEKLEPQQFEQLRQQNPDLMEPVITGLTKRTARKEKARRRILDIYRRRGEDEPRP